MKKISIHTLLTKREAGKKITMITCYDYTHAKIIEQTAIDCVLVGDSVAMVIHGYDNTIHATIEMLVLHTAAVAKGLTSKLIVADLPYMSYHKSIYDTLSNVEKLVRAGAHSIKLEGVYGHEQTIEKIIGAGTPVMAHLGLTPQHIHQLGGFKVQGKSDESQHDLIAQAKLAESLGCFAIVLECIPSTLAETITQAVKIPTIGIGAGHATTGQVLVLQDMLGMQSAFKPKFVKHFLNGETLLKASINQYVDEVIHEQYPAPLHCYE